MGLKVGESPMKYYKVKNSPMKEELVETAKVLQPSVINAKATKGGEEAGEYEKSKTK